MLKIERIEVPGALDMTGFSVDCKGTKVELILELGMLMRSIHVHCAPDQSTSSFSALVASAAELEPDEVVNTLDDILKGTEDGK